VATVKRITKISLAKPVPTAGIIKKAGNPNDLPLRLSGLFHANRPMREIFTQDA
jgi:hypothetical protein